jgi:hypothetical protein
MRVTPGAQPTRIKPEERAGPSSATAAIFAASNGIIVYWATKPSRTY